ncbi:MAG TPA: DUF1820 family protein [Gammaproteobacteria bacterium]|jgi:hypothetical protein|nr:DUF1820 family protein [Gammaproteobacteria bacterium]HET7586587.1 DUF1820 family protein [Gammaproteobacteria bacterium]
MAVKHIYKVIFLNQGKVYEIYARSVGQGALFGFVEVEQLVFGERSSVVVDPGEERLKTEFEGVERTYIPLHSIVRVDEVAKEGVAKVSDAEGGNVTPFPYAVPTPTKPTQS